MTKQSLPILLALSIAFTAIPAAAKFPSLSSSNDDIPQKNFLPPVASINGPISMSDLVKDTSGDPLEPVQLSAISSPKLAPSSRIEKLDNDLGIQTSDKEFQALVEQQRALDEADLSALWEATVEKNPVIRFSLEKLVTPPELNQSKSSFFLRKTLSAAISGAAMASRFAPGFGTSAYNQMGVMAAGDMIRNRIYKNNIHPGDILTPTEQIQLAGLVDELKGDLIHTYHDYKNTLQLLAKSHATTIKTNNQYSKALASGNSLSAMASSAAYYKALIAETELRQKAKLSRLKLERMAGEEAVTNLELAISATSDLVKTSSDSTKPQDETKKTETKTSVKAEKAEAVKEEK